MDLRGSGGGNGDSAWENERTKEQPHVHRQRGSGVCSVGFFFTLRVLCSSSSVSLTLPIVRAAIAHIGTVSFFSLVLFFALGLVLPTGEYYLHGSKSSFQYLLFFYLLRLMDGYRYCKNSEKVGMQLKLSCKDCGQSQGKPVARTYCVGQLECDNLPSFMPNDYCHVFELFFMIPIFRGWVGVVVSKRSTTSRGKL